ncbi:MAG: hypothetical protein ABIA04_15530 [Pseudomonadota bacterium]
MNFSTFISKVLFVSIIFSSLSYASLNECITEAKEKDIIKVKETAGLRYFDLDNIYDGKRKLKKLTIGCQSEMHVYLAERNKGALQDRYNYCLDRVSKGFALGADCDNVVIDEYERANRILEDFNSIIFGENTKNRNCPKSIAEETIASVENDLAVRGNSDHSNKPEGEENNATSKAGNATESPMPPSQHTENENGEENRYEDPLINTAENEKTMRDFEAAMANLDENQRYQVSIYQQKYAQAEIVRREILQESQKMVLVSLQYQKAFLDGTVSEKYFHARMEEIKEKIEKLKPRYNSLNNKAEAYKQDKLFILADENIIKTYIDVKLNSKQKEESSSFLTS